MAIGSCFGISGFSIFDEGKSERREGSYFLIRIVHNDAGIMVIPTRLKGTRGDHASFHFRPLTWAA